MGKGSSSNQGCVSITVFVFQDVFQFVHEVVITKAAFKLNMSLQPAILTPYACYNGMRRCVREGKGGMDLIVKDDLENRLCGLVHGNLRGPPQCQPPPKK